jgi:hypothetical protein
MVNHGDVLTKILHEVELVAGEQHGAAVSGPQPQGLGQARHRHRVQAGERLVEHDDLRIVHQGRGQLETLLHTARELVGAIAPPIFQTQLAEKRVRPAARVTTRQPVQPPEMGDLPASGHTSMSLT